MSNSFAFVGYPLSIDLLKKFDRKFESFSPDQLKEHLKELPPAIVSRISGVCSKNGEEIEGIFILVFLLPDQILDLNRKFVINKIVEAGKIAEKEGAKIIGLGGLTSVIGGQGEIVAKHLNIAVTTGNTYTAASVIEAALEAANKMDIQLEGSKATIIGATGSIGSACSYIFSEKVAELVLVARNQKRLNLLAESLKAHGKSKIVISTDIDQSISDADLIIASTSAPMAIIDPDKIKSGAILLDVSVPRNVKQNDVKRDDILILDGGLLSPPGKMKINFDIGLPKGIAYACLCETMILTFENMFENYTLGRGISLEKLKEIMELGSKHGFKLSGFKSFGKPISNKDVALIKANSNRMGNTK